MGFELERERECHELRGIGVHHQSGNLNHKARCGGQHDNIAMEGHGRSWKVLEVLSIELRDICHWVATLREYCHQ